MPPRPSLPARARRLVACALFGTAVGLTALAPVASAQITNAATGEKMPFLLRADSPGGTYTTTDPSLATTYGATMDGVNLSGVARIETPVPDQSGYSFFCSGARIGARAVLTAAHCVTDENTGALLSTTNQTVARFIGPGNTYQSFTASAVFVQSSFQGFYNPNTMVYQDVAVLLFDNPLPGSFATYDLFDNGALGSQTATGLNTVDVGYGTFGNGVGRTGFDGRRRTGNNVVDFVDNDPQSNSFGDLFISFEDANNNYNSVCGVYGTSSPFCHASRGSTEAGVGGGDSGGPLFINGRIAGVTSFGSYYCANANCDPYMIADTSRPFDSYGSIAGFAPASANRAFIDYVLATPEPSTVALVGFGVLGLGAAARRRRQS